MRAWWLLSALLFWDLLQWILLSPCFQARCCSVSSGPEHCCTPKPDQDEAHDRVFIPAAYCRVIGHSSSLWVFIRLLQCGWLTLVISVFFSFPRGSEVYSMLISFIWFQPRWLSVTPSLQISTSSNLRNKISSAKTRLFSLACSINQSKQGEKKWKWSVTSGEKLSFDLSWYCWLQLKGKTQFFLYSLVCKVIVLNKSRSGMPT